MNDDIQVMNWERSVTFRLTKDGKLSISGNLDLNKSRLAHKPEYGFIPEWQLQLRDMMKSAQDTWESWPVTDRIGPSADSSPLSAPVVSAD